MKQTLLVFGLLLCRFGNTDLLLAQWVQTNGPAPNGWSLISVYSFAVSGTNLFAGTNVGVFLSTNNGTTWTAANSGLFGPAVWALAVSATNVFAGTESVFLSTNNGASWTEVKTGLPDLDPDSNITAIHVNAFAVSDTNIFVATRGFPDEYGVYEGGGVFRSSNNGATWAESFAHPLVFAFAVSPNTAGGTNVFAGTDGNGIFRSTDNGTTWSPVNVGLYPDVISFAVSDTNLFAGTNGGGVFLSTNNGTNWSAVNNGLPDRNIYALAVLGKNVFAGTFYGGGVFVSSNNGTSWMAVNSGLGNADVYSLAVSGTNLFAGTYHSGVWRRPLSEMITVVEKLPTDVPTRFSLDQNYPNPFNPATTISFCLPSRSVVSLRVFDALSREVGVLLSEELSAGKYSFQWNATNLPSGVFFYRLQAGSFVETKKLVLLR